MRSYGQFCGLARALDIVGDRWTLLIVRELGIRRCRYRDLLDGLPGIATNLLADRLRALEANGLVVAEEAPPPISATLYRLTERGAELGPTLRALAGWGAREMARGQGGDAFRAHWLTMPVAVLTEGVDPDGVAPLRVRMELPDAAVDVVVEATGIRTELHPTADPDLVVTGDAQTILGTLTGTPNDDVVAHSPKAKRRFAELIRRIATAPRTDASNTVTPA